MCPPLQALLLLLRGWAQLLDQAPRRLQLLQARVRVLTRI